MIGKTIAHYQITEKLGEGGMGVVYRAQDTHLSRCCAIKVLPAEAVADPERKRRFVQEARSASSLNHPGIVTIHDISQSEGVDFIAMEYIAGKTLNQLIRRKGLPIREVLKYAVQIADALAAAHAAGIVHRDLKPANIMVTEKGLVKVLDFGLAKLTESAPDDKSGTTRTLEPVTEEGTIVGTVAYMSPEQAEGKKVDARSDIFSLGSVLYEMITGRRAFEGDGKVSTLSAIINKEPAALSDDIPYDLEKVVTRCLRKDPERRFQHMGDVKVALEELKEDSESGKLHATRPPRLHVLAWAIPALAVAVFAVAGFTWWLMRPPGDESLTKNVTFTQLTDAPGPELHPSLSPDGKSFAYHSWASGNCDIFVQRIGGKTAINLTKDSPETDMEPAFSPDGEQIAFRSERDGGGIFVMGATGENVKRLTDFGYTPAWSPDGKDIVCATASFPEPESLNTRAGQLFIVNVATGEKRLVAGAQDAHQPNWSPNGHRIAYWGRPPGASQRDIWTIPSAGGEPVHVTNDAATDWNPVWSSDGRYLYFVSNRSGSMNLCRVPIDENSGKVTGLIEAITTPSAYTGWFSISRDGRRIAYTEKTSSAYLYRVAFDPAKEAVIGPPVAIMQGSREIGAAVVSPDNLSVAFGFLGTQEDIAVIRADGTGLRKLTDDPYKDRNLSWSPDGKEIAFNSDRSGKSEIWTIRPDGSDLRQITNLGSSPVPGAWSPDSNRMAVRIPQKIGSPAQVAIVYMGQPGKTPETLPLPPQSADQSFQPMSWSPDGRLLALVLGSYKAPPGIFIYDFESRRTRKLTDGGAPQWLSDSRRLLFVGDKSKLYLIDSQSKKIHVVTTGSPAPIGSLSRDNSMIVYRVGTTEMDIWLAELK